MVIMNGSTKQSGFGVAELLIVVAIAGLVGCIGWKVWHNSKPPSTTKSQASNQKKVTTQTDAVLSSYISYALPEGWGSINCSKGGQLELLVPSQQGITSCDTPSGDPSDPKSQDSAGIGAVQRSPKDIAPESCATTLALRGGDLGHSPAFGYSCSDVTVAGKKGIREVYTYTTKSYTRNGVPSVEITYSFPANIDNGLYIDVLEASYTHYPASPYPDLTTTFDDFVRSLAFKY